MVEPSHVAVVGAHNSDVSLMLKALVAPWDASDSIKQIIDRAAKISGLKYSRAYEIWYGRARRIEDRERTAIAAALQAREEERATNELHDLRLRVARLECIVKQTIAYMGSTATAAGGIPDWEVGRTRGATDSAVD